MTSFPKVSNSAFGGMTALLLAVLSWFLPIGTCSADGERYEGLIRQAALRHKVDPLLIKAVISQESKFNERATGSSGEIGLMQVKIGAAQDWAEANEVPVPSKRHLYNPELNIEVGAWYLARALNTWSGYKACITLALCEYNQGRKTVRTWRPERGSPFVYIRSSSARCYVESVRDKFIEYSKTGYYTVALN